MRRRREMRTRRKITDQVDHGSRERRGRGRYRAMGAATSANAIIRNENHSACTRVPSPSMPYNLCHAPLHRRTTSVTSQPPSTSPVASYVCLIRSSSGTSRGTKTHSRVPARTGAVDSKQEAKTQERDEMTHAALAQGTHKSASTSQR